MRRGNNLQITKMSGGRDPVRLIEDFILSRGFNPDETVRNKNADTCRWMLEMSPEVSLELILESIRRPADTNIYMGINLSTVPLKNTQDFLVAALETADSLIGVKVSIVGHFLVMSTTINMSNTTLEELDYHYNLIMEQHSWYQDALATAMDWNTTH